MLTDKVITYFGWVCCILVEPAIPIACVTSLRICIKVKELAEVAAGCSRIAVFTKFHFQNGLDMSPTILPNGGITNGSASRSTNPIETYSILNHLKYRFANPTTRSSTTQKNMYLSDLRNFI
jgi:hypothetical protein